MTSKTSTRSSVARAYSQLYLEDAMCCLGEFFDYAVNDYGAEPDEVADLFELSRVGRAFGMGLPWAVAGKSGCELFITLSQELGYENGPFPKPAFRPDRTPEYWAGWISAYTQWRLDVSFEQLFSAVPFLQILSLYSPWHEASEERVVQLIVDRVQGAVLETQLAQLRKNLGISQRELAHRSGVSLRSIQMYEQRNKDINKAQLTTVRNLARALSCDIEKLVEPVFSMGDVA